MFATNTHIFVATKDPETRMYHGIYALIQWAFDAGGGHLYGFSRVKEEGEKEGCLLLPVSVSQGQTVAVFDLEGGVCVVREWGQFEVFFQDDGGWRLTGKRMKSDNACARQARRYHIAQSEREKAFVVQNRTRT